MNRLFCLSMVVALTSYVPIHAQPKDPPKNFTNSIGMKFVWIPPGNFTMGSPREEKERGTDEADETQHKVALTKGFYMGVHLITQEQWQTVMGSNPSFFKGEKNFPVENVSWEDCQEFIKKLREKDGKAYRLPSEAEWEYACRAGTTTTFYFGETISTDQANYNGNYRYGDGKEGVYRKKPSPVGSLPANAWGLHDMHGNLWQYCQDWYGDYPKKNVVDPQGPKAGKKRVLRGGSWGFEPYFCRSAARRMYEPDNRNDHCGVRLCLFVAPSEGAAKPPVIDNPQAQPKDPPKNFTNSVGMRFVWISPGNFMMGIPKEQKERFDSLENTAQKKITLTKGFYMGAYTVTQEQWQEIMGKNPSHFKGEKNLPVESVSWDDCQEFIEKLRKKDKQPYRLPTEAEWEYACRAGTTTPFHFGETISTDQANYNGNQIYGKGKAGKYREKTMPVGNFPANAWGLHDMHGNVWQWCEDWFWEPKKDVVGNLRVLRGGSWNDGPRFSRSAYRHGDGPDRSSLSIGFRLCFSVN